MTTKLGLIVFWIGLAGCASTGTVVVRSSPPDAQVYFVDPQSGQNALIGKTPLTFDRAQKAQKGSEVIQLRIEKEGYEPKYAAVASFGGETTFVDAQLASVGVAKGEVRQAFEMSRTLLSEANRLVLGKRFSEGLVRVEKVLEMDPKNFEAHAAKGSILYLMRDYDGARQSWSRALELNPGYETVRASLIELNLKNSERSPAQEEKP